MDNKRFYAVKIISALTQMNEKECSRVYHLIRGMAGEGCDTEKRRYISKLDILLNKATARRIKDLYIFAEGYLDYETQVAQA